MLLKLLLNLNIVQPVLNVFQLIERDLLVMVSLISLHWLVANQQRGSRWFSVRPGVATFSTSAFSTLTHPQIRGGLTCSFHLTQNYSVLCRALSDA